MAIELPIIQKTYDLIKWYIPILQRLPRNHRFTLGDRIITGLYTLLDAFIQARYLHNKLNHLQTINASLDIIRYQTRLLLDLELIETRRYEYASSLINDIGIDLGGWIKQQKRATPRHTPVTP
ncbi:MAG: diversity-generating retroelement protein Avd [Phormidesmis sp. RL_2_1]|nr:diversity-generating retroelement protein Avd [Phormidesmis sp. RL_2_1]